MAVRKSIWFYNNAVPTLAIDGTSNASNTSSTTATLDYLSHTSTHVTTAVAYRYMDMTSVTDYVIQSGDFLEYDIYWNSNLAQISFEIVCSDNSQLRDSSARDQNNLVPHPGTDLTNYAYLKWYHRKIPITTLWNGTANVSSVGKTINRYLIGAESDTLSTAMTAYLKNICITDGKGNSVYNTQNFGALF